MNDEDSTKEVEVKREAAREGGSGAKKGGVVTSQTGQDWTAARV